MTKAASEGWIDADAHIFETVDVWDRLPKEFRGRITTTAMTDDPVLARSPVGCDTAIDGHAVPIVLHSTRSQRFERLVPSFKAKYPVGAGMDPARYIADMDIEGLDRVVIYPTLFLWAAWMPQVDAKFGAAIASAYNDWVHEFMSIDRRRLSASAAISLHDVDLAIAEAKRCAERGFVGVFVRPNPLNGRTVGDPEYHRLFAVLEDLGLTVGIHEGQLSHLPTLGTDRTNAQWGLHCMSHPFEQMAAMVSLLEYGVFQKFPKLHFLFLEGGTALWLPYWLNRLDAETHLYRIGAGKEMLLPSEYFERQGWVTAEVDDKFLPQTIACVSDKKLLMSTDYPHQESPYPHSLERFREQKIPEVSRRRIGGLNALDAYPRLAR